MRIAIVGSGIAGLTAAHHLHREHDITLFEAGAHAGGHVHTHDVTLGRRRFAVDSGFIVFNQRTYPHFIELLAELGVRSQPSDMSFSVSCARSGLEYNGTSLNGVFAQRANLISPGFWGMLRDILRFNKEAPALLSDQGEEMTLGEFLDRGGYGRRFRDYYILPMGAAIWSSDAAGMLAFPARLFVRFFMNHGLLSINDRPTWRVVQGGSRSYVERLLEPFRSRVRLNTPVQRVTRHDTHVDVHLADGSERFDALFLACHSDQALGMLSEPTRVEQEVLSAIPFQANEAVLHTDARLLPRRPLARASWNCLMPDGPDGPATLTYNMNLLQGLDAPETICVTLNDRGHIDPARVIARMTYHHPVFTPAAVSAQLRHREVDGTMRTYYCGAWWHNGFHEDGVVSAMDALRHFEQDRLQPSPSVRQAA